MNEKGPESLGDIIGKLFAARGWGRQQERLRLERAWAAVAGPEISPQTRVATLKRGVFEVEVKAGVLVQELTQFHKKRLLSALRTALEGVVIKDIKFRLGVW